MNQNRYIGCCGAYCSELESCNIVGNWYLKNGYKYKKHKETISFIRENGYQKFF